MLQHQFLSNIPEECCNLYPSVAPVTDNDRHLEVFATRKLSNRQTVDFSVILRVSARCEADDESLRASSRDGVDGGRGSGVSCAGSLRPHVS